MTSEDIDRRQTNIPMETFVINELSSRQRAYTDTRLPAFAREENSDDNDVDDNDDDDAATDENPDEEAVAMIEESHYHCWVLFHICQKYRSSVVIHKSIIILCLWLRFPR
jgi:hypothetical protein